jgi:hypothetical protein
MRKVFIATAVAGCLLNGASVGAQLAVIEKGKPTTLRGEIVEISCYQKKGVAGGTGAEHVACAKDCAKQGKALGLLSEGDGLFRLIGNITNDNNAKLVPYIGQTVDVSGVQVFLSNSYDIRQSFEVQKIAAVKKGS